MNVGEAFVTVRPDTKGFHGEASRGISRSLKAIAVAGVAGFAGAGFAAKKFVDAALESNKVAAQTNAVLKSTGGVAKVSAKEVSNLATAISNKTGIDDEAIQSGQNLLLTFTNIRNEVGKGNDIFDRATMAVTDMSAALGQDTKSSAIQLGKALNDPIKGVTALQRVGVSFTASQKKQIATLVKTGDTLGAQKLILAELNKEFGGSAAAVATPMAKLRVQLGNLAEDLGNALLPLLNRLVAYFAEHLPKAIAAVKKWWEDVGDSVKSFTKRVAEVTAEIIKFVAHNPKTILAALATLIAGVVVSSVYSLVTATLALAAAGLSVGAAIALATGGLALLIPALVYAYDHSKTFRDIVDAIGRVTRTVFIYIRDHWKLLGPIILTILGPLGQVLGKFGAIKRIVDALIGNTGKLAKGIGGAVGAAAGVSGLHPGSAGSAARRKGLADGGPINGPRLVGERGPEMFWPKSLGTIIPNHQLGGMNLTVNISGVDDAPGLRRALPELVAAIRAGVGTRYAV